MNHQPRYTLEKGSMKFLCPNCNKRTFVRYVDKINNTYLPYKYGRCDRESKCAYHINPYKDNYHEVNKNQIKEKLVKSVKSVNTQNNLVNSNFLECNTDNRTNFIPQNVLEQTLLPDYYKNNTFIQNLLSKVEFPFNSFDIEKVISMYYLGTVNDGYRAGALTLPFIDIKGNIRAIQVKQFDENNHTISTDFLHSIIEKDIKRKNNSMPDWLNLYNKNEKKITCLFGEHLLGKYLNNPVAIVEAPKTAICCTLYFGFPENTESMIWLAVYNKSSFSFEKIKVLEGRKIIVFPDLSGDGSTYQEWLTKAKGYENLLNGTRFVFFDLLERLASETCKNKGYDLADYIVKHDWRLYRKEKLQNPIINAECTLIDKSDKLEINQVGIIKKTLKADNSINAENTTVYEDNHRQQIQRQNDWSFQIEELNLFFEGIPIPNMPIKLNNNTDIIDAAKFITSSFEIVNANNGNETYKPYLDRLFELRDYLRND